jgi:hypothetical protein
VHLAPEPPLWLLGAHAAARIFCIGSCCQCCQGAWQQRVDLQWQKLTLLLQSNSVAAWATAWRPCLSCAASGGCCWIHFIPYSRPPQH